VGFPPGFKHSWGKRGLGRMPGGKKGKGGPGGGGEKGCGKGRKKAESNGKSTELWGEEGVKFNEKGSTAKGD